jgi:hypothetical protein
MSEATSGVTEHRRPDCTAILAENQNKDVDGRNKSGHDDGKIILLGAVPTTTPFMIGRPQNNPHSAFNPASLITFDHFVISSLKNASHCSGELPIGT